MARIIKLFVAAVVLAGVALGGYSWLQGREPAGSGLETFRVERGGIIEKAVAVGQIEPRIKFRVKSKISGIVRRCSVDVGDRVEPGDPLFEIVPDPTPAELVEAESQLEAAQSAFNRAEADWSRSRALADQGVISSDQLDAAREAWELAKIERGRAEDNLELTRAGRVSGRGAAMESVIRATAGGIVLARNVDPGDPVVPLTSFQEGTELATIADMRDLIFNGTVDEIDVGKLEVGVEARLKIGALPDQVVTGMLTRIAPQAKEEDGARLFEVEIELDPTDRVVLRAGYSANADLIIREKNEILLIPERLVLFEDDGAKTLVEVPNDVDPAGEPVKVEIGTGLSDGLNIEVTSGLDEGDVVVQRPPRDILG
jgi:HlyD family secretion protein